MIQERRLTNHDKTDSAGIGGSGGNHGIFPFVRSSCPLYCGLIGGVGWLVYLCLLPAASAAVSTFCATVIVILLSRWFAVRKRCPATLFLISGIFPLVPGAGVYWAAYYTVSNQLPMALETGYGAVKAAVAIVLGIVFVFEMPEKWFHRKR